MGRLILASNRLPMTVRIERGELAVADSTGGLATGLRTLHDARDAVWVGWPGETWRLTPDQRADLAALLAARRVVPVELTAAEVERYYEGFSNGVLWPLLHDQLDRLPLAPRGWETYRRVNERFAEAIADIYRPGDLVWVHDYQLALVPALLRRRLPDAAIGYFLHVPFPSPDVIRVLPWRRELLEGILGASLVGVHTPDFAGHFRTAAARILGSDVGALGVLSGDRRVRVDAFPMGVDAATFDALAREPVVGAEVERLRRETAGLRLLVAVDRLDYTKGILHRLLAVERLLERNPRLRDRLRLVEVGAPSRESVRPYRDYRRQVDEMIGRINGRFGTVGHVPIHHRGHSMSRAQLVALYRVAAVGLVTPLRDGMNLVAKEFVASRVDEDGVLLLSEFAGAAYELDQALLTNPYDIESTAATIRRALDMPARERHRRMRHLRRTVFDADVAHWGDTFLAALRDAAGPPLVAVPVVAEAADAFDAPGARAVIQPADVGGPGLSTPDGLAAALAGEDRPLALCLDYDGTLVALRPTPELAVPDDDLHELLGRLVATPGVTVHVVSGRPRSELEAWFGRLPIGLHAEHGLWSRDAAVGAAWRQRFDVPPPWFEQARAILAAAADRTPGAFVEAKDASLAWHFRRAPAAEAREAALWLRTELQERLRGQHATLLEGDHVLEVRPAGLDKGLVVRALVAAAPSLCAVLLGDDATDEEMFAAARADDVSVRVGPGATRAGVRLAGPPEVRTMLGELATQRSALRAAASEPAVAGR